MPRRFGTRTRRLVDRVGDADARLCSKQLAHDRVRSDKEPALVQLGSIAGRIEDLGQRGFPALLVGAGEVELVALAASGALVKQPVVDDPEPS